jgi:MFS family permease
LFYFFNALGYVCGGPLPCQVLVSRWFDRTRGKAMGIAYLGIGIGGAIVPLLANWMTGHFGWRGSLQALGVLIVLVAFPLAYFVREAPEDARLKGAQPAASIAGILRSPMFYLLAIGSMCSIAAVGGTNQHLKLFLSLDRGYSSTARSSVTLAMILRGANAAHVSAPVAPVRTPMNGISALAAA